MTTSPYTLTLPDIVVLLDAFNLPSLLGIGATPFEDIAEECQKHLKENAFLNLLARNLLSLSGVLSPEQRALYRMLRIGAFPDSRLGTLIVDRRGEQERFTFTYYYITRSGIVSHQVASPFFLHELTMLSSFEEVAQPLLDVLLKYAAQTEQENVTNGAFEKRLAQQTLQQALSAHKEGQTQEAVGLLSEQMPEDLAVELLQSWNSRPLEVVLNVEFSATPLWPQKPFTFLPDESLTLKIGAGDVIVLEESTSLGEEVHISITSLQEALARLQNALQKLYASYEPQDEIQEASGQA